jgi:Bax protein
VCWHCGEFIETVFVFNDGRARFLRGRIFGVNTEIALQEFPERMIFERSALLIVGAFVIAFAAMGWLRPPDSSTSSPKSVGAVLDFSTASGENADGLQGVVLEGGVLTHTTTRALSAAFDRLGYDWAAVQNSGRSVPRVFLASMPHDLGQISQAKTRKAIFFKTMLPLILQANEEIMLDRRRLWRLHYDTSLGVTPAPEDRLWLAVMADRYRAKRGDIATLLARVDVIPPSMALAQAAEESGWGTSRFAREGNAIFGQWTFSEIGNLVPHDRDENKSHGIKSFGSLLDSVRAYTFNLNGHRAYREFRKLRAEMRAAGKTLEGDILIGKLKRYSQKGKKYINDIRELIRFNELQHLDGAKLGKGLS